MKTLIYLNHVDGFLDFFDPSPPMWIILLNKGYVLMWIFREPPSPQVIHMVYGCSLRYYKRHECSICLLLVLFLG